MARARARGRGAVSKGKVVRKKERFKSEASRETSAAVGPRGERRVIQRPRYRVWAEGLEFAVRNPRTRGGKGVRYENGGDVTAAIPHTRESAGETGRIP